MTHDLLLFLAGSPLRTLLVVVSLLAGALTGVPVANSAFNYTWRGADFCDDCHVHDYANTAYARSVHVGVTTCHDCHKVPIRHYPRNLYVTFLRRPQGPEDIHTPDVESVLCDACHSAESEEGLTGP
ncbi:MAG: NapC/NirT family cytochrome c, partial [Deltaproteobacteria bacterium]|nr:NapC/NirT family cytochrome c [Deltaproteobacteria bacterium]